MFKFNGIQFQVIRGYLSNQEIFQESGSLFYGIALELWLPKTEQPFMILSDLGINVNRDNEPWLKSPGKEITNPETGGTRWLNYIAPFPGYDNRAVKSDFVQMLLKEVKAFWQEMQASKQDRADQPRVLPKGYEDLIEQMPERPESKTPAMSGGDASIPF